MGKIFTLFCIRHMRFFFWAYMRYLYYKEIKPSFAQLAIILHHMRSIAHLAKMNADSNESNNAYVSSRRIIALPSAGRIFGRIWCIRRCGMRSSTQNGMRI